MLQAVNSRYQDLMGVTIYNTLSRQKEAFEPLTPNPGEDVLLWGDCLRLLPPRSRAFVHCVGYGFVATFPGAAMTCAMSKTLPILTIKFSIALVKKILRWKRLPRNIRAAYFEDMARLNILEADEYTYATHTN